MIRLASKDLSIATQEILKDLQLKIDQESSFPKQAYKAKSLWNSKGGKNGKNAFKEIFKTLYEMCVHVGICNYCEQNEANDIEHIYPKSFFPELTFNWNNYLLACKQCNSGYKLDKCFVIDENSNIVEVIRQQQPLHTTGAFINPRIEDPNDFLILNLKTFKFIIIPNLSKKDTNKAQKSIDILQLNTRDTLIQARKSASIYYYERLNLLVKILGSQTKKELTSLLTPYDDRLDLTLSLQELKEQIKISFKKHIISYQHPSVWYSIKKVESLIDHKWNKLFTELPEALYW